MKHSAYTSTDHGLTAHSRGTAIIYASALALLAILTVVSHIIMDRVIHRQQAATATIRVAGRQRTLSQRIARECEELAYGTAGAQEGRTDLLKQIDKMQADQNRLLAGDPQTDVLPPTSEAMRQLYFGDEHLALSVQAFLRHARRFATSPYMKPGNPDLTAVTTAARAPLLEPLDRALQQYGQDAEQDVTSLRRLMSMLTGAMLLTLLLEAVFIYRPLFLRMSRAMMALNHASITDNLTGLLNRGALLQLAERDLSRARADKQPLCIVMADLDHFKRINDELGHAMGDRILREFASSLEQNLRRGDRAGRLGGEEFVLILPQSGMDGGRLVAERIRNHFAEHARTLLPADSQLQPTVSMGIVALTGDRTIPQMLADADTLLYRAKHAGRNRVVAAEEASAPVAPLFASLINDPA